MSFDNKSLTNLPHGAARQATVRQLNRRLVFGLIRDVPGISRAELSGRSGISRSNVSSIVEELAATGLIDQARAEPSGRGRVPTELSINNNDPAVVAVSIRRRRTSIGIAATSGRILRSTEIQTESKPDALVCAIRDAVGDLKPTLAAPSRQLVVGVSIPGSVNYSAGRLVRVPGMRQYDDYELAEALESALGMKTVADNDCNLGALAELWNNALEVKGLADFVFLEIGQFGVGAGIVLERKLYRGHDDTVVGEFGHMVIDPQGPECTCGRRGCWERYVCDESTFQRWSKDATYQPSRFAELIALAIKEDRKAKRALEETIEFTLIGASNIESALNPQAIILAGEIIRLWPLLDDAIRSKVPTRHRANRLRPATRTSHDLFFQGAAVLAIEETVERARSPAS